MFIPIPIIFIFMAMYFSLSIKNDNDPSLYKKINKSVDDFSKSSTEKQMETIVKIMISIIISCIIFCAFMFLIFQTSKKINKMTYELITQTQSNKKK